jgi:hypothetical protein
VETAAQARAGAPVSYAIGSTRSASPLRIVPEQGGQRRCLKLTDTTGGL